MQVIVKDVGDHPAMQGVKSVTLDCPDPGGQYDTWRVSFDPKKNGTPPSTGMTIECDPKANAKGYYWIYEYSALDQGQANGHAKPVGQMTNKVVSNVARPARSQAVEIFVTGIIGRYLANQEHFPTEAELTSMVSNTKGAFTNGMKDDTDWE